jgi:hypothetical protein
VRIGAFSPQPGVLGTQDVGLADASFTQKRDNGKILVSL